MVGIYLIKRKYTGNIVLQSTLPSSKEVDIEYILL